MIDFSETKTRWAKLLENPDWYIQIVPELNELKRELKNTSLSEQAAYTKELYDFFEVHLANGDIALEENPSSFDLDRKMADTIIIHHTSNISGMSLERLSAIELIRLYAPYFYDPKSSTDAHLKGKPIYSGHVRDGKQVFWPYHWLIRKNGNIERLLEDSEIGWQAGDWDVNCRSIAICFDGDYENAKPSNVELEAAAKLIQEKYSMIDKNKIIGHCEINKDTICPSNLFLPNKVNSGWKMDLIELAKP